MMIYCETIACNDYWWNGRGRVTIAPEIKKEEKPKEKEFIEEKEFKI